MSDQPNGPGWWQASDGKWYPPELHPSVTQPPPAPEPPFEPTPWAAPEEFGRPPVSPVPPEPTWTQPAPFAVTPPTPTKRRGLIIAVAAVALVAGLIVAALFVGSSSKEEDTARFGDATADIVGAGGPTVSSDDGSVRLTLPTGWDGLSIESDVVGIGDRLFPDDAELAAHFEQQVTILPRAVVLFGLDIEHATTLGFTPNVNVIADPTAPTSLSLDAIGRGETEGLKALGGSIVDRGVVDLGPTDAYRYTATLGSNLYAVVGFVIKGSDKIWVVTYSFRSLTNDNISIASGSAATLVVP